MHEWISHADNLAIALAVAGLLGGGFISWIITFVYFKKAISNKFLCYSSITNSYLDSHQTEFQNLSVRYGDRELVNPIKYELYVWNCGNVTIDKADVATIDPIAFGRSDIEILEVGSPWSTRDSICAKCLIDTDKRKIVLEFDFLDPGDGFAVEFLADHSTPANWWRTDLQAYGTIKGLHRSPFPVLYTFEKSGWWTVYIGLAAISFFGLSAILMFYDAWTSGIAFTSLVKGLAGLLFGLFALGICAHIVSCFDEGSKFVIPSLLRKPKVTNSDHAEDWTDKLSHDLARIKSI